MANSRHLFTLFGLLLSASAFPEQPYPPICYQQQHNLREVILLGVNHYRPYSPRLGGLMENRVDHADLVFFENTGTFPKDGIFRIGITTPAESRQGIRLDRFVNAQDIPRLSELFGKSFSPGTEIPLATVGMFVDSILVLKLIKMVEKDRYSGSQPFAQIRNTANVESASYAYALTRSIPASDLESLEETLGVREFPAIKNEAAKALECTNSAACIEDYKQHLDKRLAYAASEVDSDYDAAYELSVNSSVYTRAVLAPRNERMTHRLLASLPKGKRALVIVGAGHVGGPNGMAAKLEAAGFGRVSCGRYGHDDPSMPAVDAGSGSHLSGQGVSPDLTPVEGKKP